MTYLVVFFPSDAKDFSVEVSVEMPFDIRTIDSPSHSIRIKVITFNYLNCK